MDVKPVHGPDGERIVSVLRRQELSDVLVGEDNLRMMDAANDCGWHKMPKMIDPERCISGCSDCMPGCTRRAKWTRPSTTAGDSRCRKTGET